MNFGTLYELQWLNSHTNRLGTGGDRKGNELIDFLTSLSNCSSLQWLDMAINGFKSLLPNSIANLSTTITWLALDGNYIFGSIPLGIGNLVNLRTLYLSTNMVVGSIPNSIGKLSNLEKLLLLTNNISREIPSSIGNITRLEQQDPNHLTFVRRLNIAIDVASAFDYLHHHCEVAIVHSDLTPSNILLDDNLCAHVGDFGLRRILLATTGISNHHQSSSIGIKGTVGYVAPEYGMGDEVSTQGDMYTFGWHKMKETKMGTKDVTMEALKREFVDLGILLC
ncbi:hypothetical protein TEA_003903 [Camellia sinensis var. sinensis]|uniref:Protein kinase domain-containing protein n=1 Tax=Camellia sinensis var. sinensis TaxID=542762 RepID=A0A4S4EDB8_CAMSN|nr:hypothetical protein TEA_003903 [Camellia sinensis var. sinensis]